MLLRRDRFLQIGWGLCIPRAWAGAEDRLISTAPSFTETLFALGAGAKVKAVSEYCHFPEEVRRLPRIGSYLAPNIEAIARLRPTLVLTHAEQRQVVERLTRLGLRTLPLRNTTLEDFLQSIRAIGEAIRVGVRAKELEGSIRSRLHAIGASHSAGPRRTLLFVVGRTPGRLDGMIAAGKGSYLNDVIRIAGGRNVLDDSPVAYPSISLETVVRLNPDVIVDMGDMTATTGVSESHKKSVVALWSGRPGVRAAQEKRVFAVAADLFVVPGPRVVEAAEAFARMLHGQAA